MNSRLLTARYARTAGIFITFWMPLFLLSLLLVVNTIPYFSFETNFPFLADRAVLYAKPVWRWAFYIHIAAGCFCVLSALTQFSSWILKKQAGIHRIAGRIYVFVVLLLGAPTGFYMTFFAEGGWAERGCFIFMALAWFYSTYRGFTAAARDRNFLLHKFWMYRSYAMALTAVTFRIYHIIFYHLGMDHLSNYSLALWISVVGNALAAELIIRGQAKNYLRTLTS
jgi:hypothetical protein